MAGRKVEGAWVGLVVRPLGGDRCAWRNVDPEVDAAGRKARATRWVAGLVPMNSRRLSLGPCRWAIVLWALVLIALAQPLGAQFDGFSKQQLLKYTQQNPYERSADGRPHVPDYWLKRLATASSSSAAEVLREAGYPNQWEDGWAILHPEKKLIGRAFTVQFMPSRPDLEAILEGDASLA